MRLFEIRQVDPGVEPALDRPGAEHDRAGKAVVAGSLQSLATRHDPGHPFGIEQQGPDLFRRGRDMHLAGPVNGRARRLPRRFVRRNRGRGRRLFGLEPLQNPGRPQRQPDIVAAQCVRHRIRNAHRRRILVAFGDALGAEAGVGRRAGRRMDQLDVRQFGGRRHEIFREGSGAEGAVRFVAELLEEGRAEGRGPGAPDLPLGQTGIQDRAAIVGRDIFVDGHDAGVRIDLHAAEIEAEAVGERGVDLVLRVRRRQFRRVPHGGFADAGLDIVRQARRRPVGQPADAVEGNGVVRIVGGVDPAVGEFDIVGRHIKVRRRDPRHFLAHPHGGQVRRARRGRREAAGIVAGRDRPAVLGRVRIQRHDDVVRGQPELVGDDLGQRRLMALALGHRIADDVDRAQGVDRHGDRGDGAVLRPGALALPAGLEGRDIAHVRLARLDAGGVADAVEFACRARGVPLLLQRRQTAFGDGLVDGPVVIARIEQGAGDRFVGEHVRRNQVAADDGERILPGQHGDLLHHALDREIELRPAEAAHRAGRAFVGRHDMVGDFEVPDAVAVGGYAVHPVDRRRHRRAQIGAVIVPVGEPQAGDRAVLHVGGLDPGDPVGRDAGGRQMLQPVLDPLHRPPRLAGQHAQHDDIGEDRELGAEAAAGIFRAAVAQGGGADAQGQRHHGVDRKRALKIGQHIEAAGLAVGLRHNGVGFHRRDGIARIADGQFRRGVRLGEGLVRLAMHEMAFRDTVGLAARMQERRLGLRRRYRVDDRRQHLVGHLDEVGGVLGPVAIGRGDRDHRLADIAHLVDREAVIVDRVLEADDHRIGLGRHIRAGHDGENPRHGERFGRVDGDDLGMGVRRADEGGLQGALPDRHIVDEAALAAQQGAVFDPRHAPADMTVFRADLFRDGKVRHSAPDGSRG